MIINVDEQVSVSQTIWRRHLRSFSSSMISSLAISRERVLFLDLGWMGMWLRKTSSYCKGSRVGVMEFCF